jgi:transposase-like protein
MSFRVIYHEPVCPDCGSDDISTEEITTTDGASETAYVCSHCHLAWPLACISDLDRTPEGR